MTTPQEYFKDFPEAPFSDTFKWVDQDGYEHMVTARSWSAQSLFQSIAQVKEQIVEMGGGNRYIVAGTPSAEPRSVNNSQPTKKYEAKPVPTNEIPEGLPEGIEVYKEDFDYFEVTPQPDNKASVAFFKDGLQYPVGAKINKWKNAAVVTALVPLGDIDPSKAQKVRVAGAQYWSKGAPYTISTGAHAGEQSNYKDLRLVTANFG